MGRDWLVGTKLPSEKYASGVLLHSGTNIDNDIS